MTQGPNGSEKLNFIISGLIFVNLSNKSEIFKYFLLTQEQWQHHPEHNNKHIMSCTGSLLLDLV